MTDRLYHVLFQANCQQHPHRTAISADNGTLTYQELDERSNQVAHELRRLGIGREQRVGLMVQRNTNWPVAALGILKAGAAYVPMDPNYPAGRLGHIMQLAGMALVITEQRLEHKWAQLSREVENAPAVLFADAPGLADGAASATEVINLPDDLFCVLFTSGSTGIPKGVCLRHQSIVDFIDAAARILRLDSSDRVAAVSSMSFDMSLFELFAPLLVGASSHIAPAETVRDPWRVLRFLEEHQITTWHSVPTMWAMWLNLAKSGAPKLPALRRSVLAGERLPVEYVRKAMTLFPHATVVNAYGPTETTIWMSANPISELPFEGQERVHVGPPMEHVQVYVVDDDLNLCPEGEVGELCIAGGCLAAGYLNDEERTRASFVPNPWAPGSIMYKSGDLGRFLPDGTIDIVGRKDLQVKIRGFRIELGEIESAVLLVPGVTQAAVIVNELADGSKDLVCVMTRGESDVTVEAVRAHLKEILPEYMVPHRFLFVASIPVNPNGKTDRKALQAMLAGEQAAPTAPTPEDTGATVASIWAEILGHRQFTADDSFFDVGGDSIKAVKVRMALDERYPDVVEVADIFAYPSVKLLSAYLQERLSAGSTADASAAVAVPKAQEGVSSTDIAVIGLACRFPGGATPEEFWQTLAGKREMIRELPGERRALAPFFGTSLYDREGTFCKWGSFLDRIDQFDAQFFDMSSREATLVDPQQRLLLEVVTEALESGGYGGQKLWHTPTGVFVACSGSDYAYGLQQQGLFDEPFVVVGNQVSMVPNRISYWLNLTGPSVAVDTACSSSGVALHMACRALQTGECDQAIVGGVTLNLHPQRFASIQRMTIASPTGACRAFDQAADGSLPGEGAGVLLLKPLARALADGDDIHAVIKGTAVNHGGRALGPTAPNPLAQEAVIRQALQRAAVAPESISFIEAHGTGTRLGDPIEMKALASVFGNSREGARTTAVGSVKTVIGHLGETATMASLIKVILALKHRQIPATLHFQTPNPELGLERTPFFINTDTIAWDPVDGVRRAGISSFGLTGSNAHIVLEEAPLVQRPAASSGRPFYVVALSAKHEAALAQKAEELQRFLEAQPQVDLGDLAYTLATGRGHYSQRLAVVADSVACLQAKLAEYLHPDPEAPARVVYGAGEEAAMHLAQLYADGAAIPWDAVFQGEAHRRITLPTYPFQRQRFWWEPAHPAAAPVHEAAAAVMASAEPPAPQRLTQEDVEAHLMAAIRSILTEPPEYFDVDTDLFTLDIDSLGALELSSSVTELTHVPVSPRVVYDHPTVRQLAAFAIQQIDPAGEDGGSTCRT